LFLGMFVILGVSTTLFGSLLGVTVQWGVAEVLAPFIPVALPAPGLSPLLLGGAAYPGFIFASGETSQDVETALRQAEAALRFVIAPTFNVKAH